MEPCRTELFGALQGTQIVLLVAAKVQAGEEMAEMAMAGAWVEPGAGAGTGAGAAVWTEERVLELMHCADVTRSSTQFMEIRADQGGGAAEDRLRWVRKTLEMWRLQGDSEEEKALWSSQLEVQLRKEKVFYMRSLLAAGVAEKELKGAWGELLKEAAMQSRVSIETELFHRRREYLKAEGAKEVRLKQVMSETKAAKERFELNLSCTYVKQELEEAQQVEETESFFLKEVHASIRAQTVEMKMLLEVQKARLSEILGGKLEDLVEMENKRKKTGEAEEKDKEVEKK